MIGGLLKKLGLGEPSGAPAGEAPSDGASVRDYVECLPEYMLRRSLQSLPIERSRPLPWDDELAAGREAPPEHEAVVNCLKLLCGYDPIMFSETRRGSFTVERKTCTVGVNVQFTARPERPCVLSLTVRRRRG